MPIRIHINTKHITSCFYYIRVILHLFHFNSVASFGTFEIRIVMFCWACLSYYAFKFFNCLIKPHLAEVTQMYMSMLVKLSLQVLWCCILSTKVFIFENLLDFLRNFSPFSPNFISYQPTFLLWTPFLSYPDMKLVVHSYTPVI